MIKPGLNRRLIVSLLAVGAAAAGGLACSSDNSGGTGGNGGGAGAGGAGGIAATGAGGGGGVGTGGAGGVATTDGGSAGRDGGGVTATGGAGGNSATGGTGGGGVGTGSGGATGTVDAGPGDAPLAPLSDGQVAAIMIEANGGEVLAAGVASSKSMNPAVLDFAAMMTTDHNAANARLVAILQSTHIAAEDSDQRRTLSMQADLTLNGLWAAPLPTFDTTYVQSQVEMHMMVLALLRDVLIPTTQNAQLRAELQMEQTAVTAHLQHAQQLLAALAADGGASDARGQ
jgi:predicted outer membrane protein